MNENVIATGTPQDVKRESARRTRRSFLVGGAAAAAGAGAAYMINNSTPVGRLQAGLRDVINADADVSRALFHERGLAPTYHVSQARPLRLNGNVGLEQNLVLDSWRLQMAGVANPERSPLYAKDVTAWQYQYAGDTTPDVQDTDVKSAPGNGAVSKTGEPRNQQPANTLNPTGAVDSAAGSALAAHIAAMVEQSQPRPTKRNIGSDEAGPSYSSLDIGTPGLLLSMSDLLQLPRVEFVTEFKCIEGWSSITQWAGVRLRDLIDLHPPQKINGRDPRFVYIETPDGNYYGGYDMAAARHPQSLLVTEMGGQPLAQEHGAPLRLHMPIKYGYKQLKRVGLIAFTDQKPDDYWTKLGYDWYAGL
jgi:hypothetical protein